MNRFERKQALVTGGSSGIGLAVARAFIAEGARVIITGRNHAALVAAARELGPRVVIWLGDARRLADHRALAAHLKDTGTRLDAVFINAGVARFAPFEAVDEKTWDESFDINVKGAYFQLQALLPYLNPHASVVLNGSINAHIGMPASSVYAASKAALISLARTLSAELLPNGVRVNVVSPGPIATPIYGKLGLPPDELEATAEQILGQIPLGRFGEPEELASTVLHLSAPESAYIVGAEIIVDGGMGRL